MSGIITSHNGSHFNSLLNEKVSWSCALAIAFSILASPTYAQNPPGNTVYDLVPIGSTGPVTSLVGNTIEIPSGGVVVELELRVSGWAATGDGTILSVQATIDGSGYCSGIGDAINPLGYPGAPLLACPQGNGCPTDGDTCDQGGFIKEKVCAFSPNAGDPCTTSADCPGGFCADNPDYLFSGFNPLAAIAYPGLDYEIAGLSTGAAKQDAGLSEMFGTLLVEIPPGAAGTYNINFKADSLGTFNADGLQNLFAVVNLNGATITVTSGACCFNIGPGTSGCMQNVTAGVCAGLAGPSFLNPGAECPPIGQNNQGPDSGTGPCCGGCQTDTDCGDRNDCTTDICSFAICGCININNFNDTTDCCNPSGASLTPLDDLDPCTSDICDAQTGSVTHEPIINCTACMGDFDCDDNNACTDNSCDLITGACANPLSFDVVTQCCDSATGAIVTFGDGDPCTNDFCDAQTFQVTHTPIPDCIFANNRYVTFFPNRGNLAVNYNLTETTSGRQKWLLPPTSTDDITHSIARLTDTMPPPRVWSSQALHIGDCLVSPGFTYNIRSTTDGLSFSAPVFVDTVGLPTDGRHWADCVGSFDASTGNWGPPDGLLTASDILAVVQAFQLSQSSIPTPWADLSPERPNGIVNSSDILAVALAFQFAPYPHANPANCP